VTRTGDDGQTSLLFNRRVSKSDPRVAAYGTVDELNAALGLLRASMKNHSHSSDTAENILTIQRQLVGLMGEMATHPDDMERYLKSGFEQISSNSTGFLEEWILKLESRDLKLEGWVMPGENPEAAAADMARTVCRRAEREVTSLLEKGDLTNPNIGIFLNRLSDLLWLLGRDLEHPHDAPPKAEEKSQAHQ
jgi:cob(I)alamin adenosyltransferase